MRNKISKNQGKFLYVKQTADIDLTELSKSHDNPPLPLAGMEYDELEEGLVTNSTNFYGEYDGGGYTILNWSIRKEVMKPSGSYYYISMFGKVGVKGKEKTIIKNLNIDGFELETPVNNSSIPGFSFIASDVYNAEITNCNVENSTVKGVGNFYFGAIAARNNDATISNCIVKDCKFTPNNTNKKFGNIGSLCGFNSGIIKNCFAYNVILNGNTSVGGLVGEMNGGSVENCGFNGQIGSFDSGVDNSGGLCGTINKGSFINCFTIFDNGGYTWTQANQVGGLIGVVNDKAEIVVKNCYSFPQISVDLSSSNLNLHCIVGLDDHKEDPKRLYESCYCYENAFGKGVTSSSTTLDFSQDYKDKHKLLIASCDFMRSGCLAEILSDYHNANLVGPNQWREDVEFQNDTLPVLRFMVDDLYDVDPFCHPGIYTLSHSESGNVSKLNGQLKYITDDQLSENWSYGLEVKVGNGNWERLSVKGKSTDNKIDFNTDYTYSNKKTTVYRAYTFNSAAPTRVAYGKIDTICVATASVPDTVYGCDSIKYEGKWFFPKDNGSYINKSNEEVIIKIGETYRQTMFKEGDCGENSVTLNGLTYDSSGIYVDSFINLTGCMTYKYQEIKLNPTLPAKDSLKVFSIGEMSYTYSPIGGVDPQTVEVGTEYVKKPTLLVEDHIGYKDNISCDSAIIVVKYVIPIKITKTEDEDWSCEPVVYNGKKYSKETIVNDTIIISDADVPGGKLYEIRSHHVKVAIPDTIEETISYCEKIPYDCPGGGKCYTTEPFDDTTYVKSNISGCQCPKQVIITHNVLGNAITRDTNIVSCGPYTYINKRERETWYKSGDYTKKRSGKNVGACDNDTFVTYHLTIIEPVVYNDTTIHGCEKVVYKTLSGKMKTFDKSQDYVDELETSGGCSSKRTVHVYVHEKINKSSLLPLSGCAPYSFVKLNGETEILEAGNHIIKDTLKSTDGCDCDSIVKNTTIFVENPTVLEEITRNGCDEVTIEGVKYTKDTSFVVEKPILGPAALLSVCKKQFQPYRVNINSSIVEQFNIDTCGSYSKGGQTLKTSGIIEVPVPTETGCNNKEIYNVRIIEPVNIDSVVYACDNYVHKFYDGHQEMVEDDGIVLIDKIQSKVCLCDSIIRKVTVHISHDSHEVLPAVSYCGPYTYVKKSDGKKILIESSQIVKDTLTNRYGCHIYYETEVNIIPVETTFDTLDACKEYHSVLPVWNYNNLPVDVIVETPSVQTAELIFLNPNVMNTTCMDTTKLFLTVHGVGNITADPVVACDSFIYTDFDGSSKTITSTSVIVDTLKSNVCDCDSVILTTNITVNNSYPESLRETNTLRACDTVKYTNSKGEIMTFTDNIQFLDTFQMKNTGCDSVVIVDVIVPKSTGSVTILSACGDTTLYDELNGNYPHKFEESGVWRQILSQNEDGCDNYKEWHVNITPTPRDTIFEHGCGELSFRGDTYTSENEKAASFSLVVNGATKCDSIHNYILTVYPKYNHSEVMESCDSIVRNGKVYKQSVFFVDTLLSRNNCDSIISVDITIHPSPNITDYMSGCNEVKFVDEDFNGGMPIYVHHDTTIYVDKFTDKGCEYQLIQQIDVDYPSYTSTDVFECFDSQLGYASYRDLHLTSDTVVYDTISSTAENKCGVIVANIVNLVMPVHDTIYVDSCLRITYEDSTYIDSAEVIKKSKTTEMGCDSFTHVMLNVNKCFPYPILVNKYNWILVCNDVILDDDKFKLKSNVKYKWYKDERLVSTTSESYFTEDKELDGCYQVGIVIDGGDEYMSDVVCIDENHGYSISPQPNPVGKLQPVTIICDFPVEGVVGTKVEVFNMMAEKVYVATATSNEIVIPGMTVSGYYLVRLTTVSDKVLTAKYLVK
ncbi:MAG: hypothetical protein Q4B61_10850 [Bacteroidales bacterium]|nr:hypothetical protein [Bacteroidales bacterium]